MRSLWLFACLLALLGAGIASAQGRVVTADDVHRVAERMYCPVCENIPLDDCGTTTCMEWKREIAIMLSEGWTSDEIVNDFVARYGQHVVGVPHDPTLRALSLFTPIVLVLVAGWFAWRAVAGWQKRADAPVLLDTLPRPSEDNGYRERLERDLG
jgi:cytochrome c-type biogenesis protein CcmH